MLSFKEMRGGETLKKFALEDLKRMQEMPLEDKVKRTELLIKEWYEHYDGNVIVSFSGGKDSTVLLHIVRKLYPDVQAVFFDTGLEYPEIREHVKTFENVMWMKPRKNFKEVILDVGYPIISKEVSGKIANYQRFGKSYDDIPKKYRYLVDKEAPFKISDRCCYYMKKYLIDRVQRYCEVYPMLATTAEESNLRKMSWVRYGCNAFAKKHPRSAPMSFWREQDILQYIYENNLPIAKVYGEVIKTENGYDTTGVKRTGCMFCMYGVHMEGHPNRFEKMKLSHPKQYEWCMRDIDKGGLGLDKVLNYIGVEH